jgi:hypothetical protein
MPKRIQLPDDFYKQKTLGILQKINPVFAKTKK